MQNNREQAQHIQPPKQEQTQNTTSLIENVASALGGILDFQSYCTGYDPDEAEFLRQQKRKKKKKKGFP